MKKLETFVTIFSNLTFITKRCTIINPNTSICISKKFENDVYFDIFISSIDSL